MTVSALLGTLVSLNPSSVRYSLNVNSINGSLSGIVILQRSQLANGVWLDDPTVGSGKAVALPTDSTTSSAVSGIISIFPSVLTALGISATFTNCRFQLIGNLLTGGVLDINTVLQMQTPSGWQCVSIPSLNSFLSSNPTLATTIIAAWSAMDAAINAANATNRWL